MDRRYRVFVLLGTILIAAIVGVISYNAGVSRGLALVPPQAAAPGASPVPYYGYRPWGFGFFSPLAFLFLLFVVSRLFFWGGPFRHRHFYGAEYWPERMEDWHRRAHERMNRQAPEAGRDKV